MLQQILRDMYIDPELLAELDEEQKQILFCKMRQEQKRRWEERECLLEREEMKKTKAQKANRKGNNVRFLEDADLKPWTWVMGEHQDDLNIEELIEAENIRRAKILVEQELYTISKNPNVANVPLINGPWRDESADNDLDIKETPTNEMPLSGENNAFNADVNTEGDTATMETLPDMTSSPEAETPPDVDVPEIPTKLPPPSSSNSDEAQETGDLSISLLRPSKFVPPSSGSYSKLFTAKDVPSKDLGKVPSTATNVPIVDSPQTTSNTSTSKTSSPTISTISPSLKPTSSSFDETTKHGGGVQRPEVTAAKISNSVASRSYTVGIKPAVSAKPAEKIRPESVSPPISTEKTEGFKDKQLASTKSSPVAILASQFSLFSSNSSPKTTAPTSSTKPAVSTKPSEKFQPGRNDSNWTDSTPGRSQNKSQTTFTPSPSERKHANGDGFGRSGENAAVGSIVEKAKLDMASFRERRMREIYSGIQSERQKSLERATKESKNIVQLWLAQEKKVKEADEERKMIARRVREDNARAMRRLRTESQVLSLFTDDPSRPGYSIHSANQSMQRVQRPSGPSDVIGWYQKVELKRGAGLDPKTGKQAPYYFGMLSRRAAEKKLSGKPEGTFLVRLSTQIFGYAVSLRGSDSFHNIKNIRHYLIEVTSTGYQFFGANQPTFLSLHSFIEHYKKNPLSLVTSDRLKVERGLLKDDDDDDDGGDPNASSSSSSSSDSVLDC